MRRLALIAVLGALAAGCGGEETVSPSPETVEGTPPAAPTPQPAAQGDPEAGKAIFAESGCGGCHAFEPAGTDATVGPNLAEVGAHAEAAGKPLPEYVLESIENPNAFVVDGYQPIMPPFDGTPKELADLAAFITAGS